MSELTITERVASETERMDFLPSRLGNATHLFESRLFSWAEQTAKNYDGGYWDFVELSNGGFYCRPEDDKIYHCENIAGKTADVKNDVIGLFATCAALADISWHVKDDRILQYYEAVRAFIALHPEHRTLWRLMD
ncbi:TPA: antirestriction protein [Neisseria meningitidis]